MAARRILIMPEYNEARTIVSVLERCLPWVDRIIVVDDGSTDESRRLVNEMAQQHPEIIVLPLAENQGMSGALLAGFCYAWRLEEETHWLYGDDWIITIDADGQHLPEEIPAMIRSAEEQDVDVLLARRNLAGYPWFKHIGNWGLSTWASLLTLQPYHDVECGFRVFRARVLEDLLAYFLGRRYGCAQEIGVITAKRGWHIANNFPTEIAYYRAGARVTDGFTNLLMGLRAWWRVQFGKRYRVSRRAAEVLGQTEPIEHNDLMPQAVGAVSA
jgi:glycosyltransferase involved in cell wall biosynthesis